jgi:hypothetical protein
MASPPPSQPAAAHPAPANPGERRGRWVAIVTGAISVLVAVLYLLMIVVLDSRGPLQPPPPEALGAISTTAVAPAAPAGLGGVGAAAGPSLAGAQPPG